MTPTEIRMVAQLPLPSGLHELLRALADVVEAGNGFRDDWSPPLQPLRDALARVEAQQGTALASPLRRSCSRCDREINSMLYGVIAEVGVWCSDYCRAMRAVPITDAAMEPK